MLGTATLSFFLSPCFCFISACVEQARRGDRGGGGVCVSGLGWEGLQGQADIDISIRLRCLLISPPVRETLSRPTPSHMGRRQH